MVKPKKGIKKTAEHSSFIGFSEKEGREIAIYVIVEDGGSGGDLAAPIASLMIEKYLSNSDRQERKISDTKKEREIIKKSSLYLK